ncbi:MAG TPA: ABC transporter substrate-binding protein [Candidatus Paceibacterota bacterium]|nr:ABC transporter substrate-binding protein [Candidatus Paceibacterota bacterium]HRZ29242.1 ABC transporter substrate-binding protein [Candidatus Paceibacterota bacterium]
MLKDIWTKYNKIIIGGAIILIIIFGSSVFTLFRRPIKLTVWGSNLSSEEFDLLTASIKPKSGNVIKFEYTEIESEKYEKTILESFINSESPDIFLITDDQIGKFKKLISPLSLEDKNYNLANLKKDYPTIIVDNAVIDNNLYVSPITIDSLAMYYNRNIFDSLSIANPPKT